MKFHYFNQIGGVHFFWFGERANKLALLLFALVLTTELYYCYVP